MTHFSTWIDGPIVGLYLLVTMIAGVFVRRYIGKVEDFLVAGREMDVSLGIASLAATEFGIVTCMYTAEAGYRHGFSGATPGICQAIAMLIVGVTGFCIKPMRDAGVITIPELFERRFGSGVRWTAGLVIVLGGLLNMGVFLRIGGEFLMIVCGIRSEDLSLEWMMTILLIMVAVYTTLGGMLSVLVTDFLQFVVMSVGLITVTILILINIGWGELASRVEKIHGPGGFNPFINAELGWPYVVFSLLVTGAATLTWQASVARVLAAKDSNTARRIYTRTSFFFVCRFLIPSLWGIAALGIVSGNAGDVEPLHAMPQFLAQFVPIGVMGLLVSAMLAADMSTDSSYMLTWATVIYNDLLSPWHRGQFSEKVGLLVVRSIVVVIGIFLLFYGLWYPLEDGVWEYLAVTATIYLASISTLLIACCYWKGANDWGAYSAMAMGAAIPAGYLVLQQLDSTSSLAKSVGPFYSGIASYFGAAAAMIVGSVARTTLIRHGWICSNKGNT